MREVPVLDSAGQKAFYQDSMRLKAELAQRKPRRESIGTGNPPQKYIALPASTQAVA
jgi:hypothetical protein